MSPSAGLDPRVVAWRHELHRIPETAFAEHATSAYVARATAMVEDYARARGWIP